MQNFYKKYQNARNKVWQISIDYNINTLPVNMYKLLYKMEVLHYSYTEEYRLIKNDFIERTINNDGVSTIINNKYVIFCNDIINNLKRVNFTLAHELGHIAN